MCNEKRIRECESNIVQLSKLDTALSSMQMLHGSGGTFHDQIEAIRDLLDSDVQFWKTARDLALLIGKEGEANG